MWFTIDAMREACSPMSLPSLSAACGYIVLEFFVVFVVGERLALLVAKHESLGVEE
jgi:hypothetical protein